jgi:GNAT superfamily N-acetyltransferase
MRDDDPRLTIPADVRVEHFVGRAAEPWVEELARLRIEVFRDFPYLYDGSLDYERRYLTTYVGVDAAVVVVARAGDRVIGASTALPLAAETAEVRAPFLAAGIDPTTVLYFGESVLERGWRGRGIGVRFFLEREAHARRLAGIEHTAFCAVERPGDHPRRPPGYHALDGFWQRRGYRRRDDLVTTMTWKDLDEDTESPKPMVFWMRALAGDGAGPGGP